MLQLKNTICCPGCAQILQVSAQVVSDGKVYQYYLCPQCADAVKEDPETKTWKLQGSGGTRIPEVVQFLRALAIDDWLAQSGSRKSVIQTRGVTLPKAKSGPPCGMGIVVTQASPGIAPRAKE